MKFPRGPVIRVQVKKETITSAVTADSTKCWIAESIKAAYPEAKNVAVDVATTRFSDFERGLRFVYLTPYTAQKALIEFDEGTPPVPFSFLLRNAHVTRAGITAARKEGNKKRAAASSASLTKKLAKPRIQKNPGAQSGALPRRVGGRRPPQLKTLRQFGVRAFRGASKARLEADIAARARRG